MTGIEDRVPLHRLRQRPLGPVGALELLVELNAEVLVDERSEPQRRLAGQPRGDHGVEQAVDASAVGAVEHPEVVVGAVQDLDPPTVGQLLEQRPHVEAGERVDEQILLADGDLQKAQFLGIVVKRVRLGIHGQRAGP